jgi:hypothetical protein
MSYILETSPSQYGHLLKSKRYPSMDCLALPCAPRFVMTIGSARPAAPLTPFPLPVAPCRGFVLGSLVGALALALETGTLVSAPRTPRTHRGSNDFSTFTMRSKDSSNAMTTDFLSSHTLPPHPSARVSVDNSSETSPEQLSILVCVLPYFVFTRANGTEPFFVPHTTNGTSGGDIARVARRRC